MLYGIRRDLQKQLIDQGYGVRVYVPFGTEWYPYFMRRLAERPAKRAFFLLENFFQKLSRKSRSAAQAVPPPGSSLEPRRRLPLWLLVGFD